MDDEVHAFHTALLLVVVGMIDEAGDRQLGAQRSAAVVAWYVA
jgi:hypothetical protein